eukprot:CAMPEP_0119564846 /NCGR_PEP_ID=MMETSP1352-20130426/28181_1 /TAXON_ID=265584 /ORGANISM="Stauroneis constricta, Strain CCMP1120" /LENGTH=389 /DNA_ID=CAMNT_0007613649 /DNA_START=33 /DNA_END=1202 /DNA_ORIENTATION=-
MMFIRALSLLAMASPIVAAAGNLKATGLTTDSDIGQALMSKARALNNDNNNGYYNWIAKYSIKFDGCSAIPSFEREEGIRSQLLAKFRLCPNDSSCSSCPKSGEYVVELREFAEAVRNAKLEANEYNCEVQEQTCEYSCEQQANNYNNGNNNNNGNDNGNNYQYDEDTCVYNCMVDAQMGYCQQDQDEFDYNEFMECRALENDNNNNNNNYNYNQNQNYVQYYTGAYCNSNGVFLGMFTDSSCSKPAPTGTYEKYFGYSLPTDPVVTYECISCKEANNQDENNQYGNDYYDQDYVSDMCEQLYEEAGHCERNMDNSVVQYPDESACEMIHSTLAKLDRAFSSGGGPRASVFFAWMFGLGCVGLGVYIYYLQKRMGRKVDLANDGNGVTA